MGIVSSFYTESFPPKSKFNVSDIPDQTGRVVIVTGGNSGIGEETVKALLKHNAKVYMAARSEQKARESIEKLKKETGKEAIFLKLDLANLKAIKASVEDFLSKETDLHVLYNNGGVMTPPIDMLTDDGYDLQFGTNVLGHFYFTKLLLPALLQGAKSSADGKARVVNVSSSAQLFCPGLDFNAFKEGPARKKLGSQKMYFQSKFGNVVFSNELAKRYGDQGIVSSSLNPGNINTNLGRYMSPFMLPVLKLLVHPVEYGALTQLWAGTSAEGLEFNGKFLRPWARLSKCNPKADDEKVAEDLWQWLEEQVKDV